MNKRKKLNIICFDFDGMIIPLNGDWQNNPIKYQDMKLLDGARETMNRIYHKYQIYILSARFNPDINKNYYHDLKMVEHFLIEKGVRFDCCTAFKPIAKLYPDDCGYKFTTWEKFEEDLNNMDLK